MKFSENAFVNLPLKVLYCNLLTLADIKVYGTIANICNMNTVCKLSNKDFKELLNIDERTIQRSLAKLEKLTFIKIRIVANKRQISLPRFADFQAVDNFTCLQDVDNPPPGIGEIVDYINAKQKAIYPAYDPVNFAKAGPYGVQIKTIIFILAKAVYDSKYIGVKLAGRKRTEDDLKNLVEVFDISSVRPLAQYLAENFEKIQNIDFYIMASLFDRFKKEINEFQEDKELHTERQANYETFVKVKEALNKHFNQDSTS